MSDTYYKLVNTTASVAALRTRHLAVGSGILVYARHWAVANQKECNQPLASNVVNILRYFSPLMCIADCCLGAAVAVIVLYQ